MIRGRPESWTLRAASITLAGSLGFAALGGDSRPAPSGHYVDCQRNPGSSVAATEDMLHPTAFDIGDVQTGADGSPQLWREKIEIDTSEGPGRIAIIEDGFGPLLGYDEIASGQWGLSNDRTGSQLTVSLPPGPASDVSSRASVILTFTCRS